MAVAQPDGSYKLYGYKWFSSATDSDMTFTLARIVDDNGQVIKVNRFVYVNLDFKSTWNLRNYLINISNLM